MNSPAATTPLRLADWQERAAAHRQRALRHTGPARRRRDRGEAHPILDFLFEYYPFPFALLEKWHPEPGLVLEASASLPSHLRPPDYRQDGPLLRADASSIGDKQRLRMERTVELLEATRDRSPNFACHGLHEWAMVYQGQHIRHDKTLSLRLPQAEIDSFVESRAICCSHHDAFRFFAAKARCFNHLQPSLETRTDFEQPACLHANMDLYKWAAKAMPWVGSGLLLDCFELAVDLRDLDMRASPYDLSPWQREPVRIETAEGRQQYEQEQRQLAERAKPLRQRLITALRAVMGHSELEIGN